MSNKQLIRQPLKNLGHHEKINIHWSFWVVCIVALIWNVMGCINFTMQMNREMLASYPEAARSLIEGRPLWVTVTFAIAVFGGAFGDILLLCKKSVSFYLFIASFLGVLVTNAHTFTVTSSTDIWVGSLMSLMVSAFLIWYSKRVERKGWIN